MNYMLIVYHDVNYSYIVAVITRSRRTKARWKLVWGSDLVSRGKFHQFSSAQSSFKLNR